MPGPYGNNLSAPAVKGEQLTANSRWVRRMRPEPLVADGKIDL